MPLQYNSCLAITGAVRGTSRKRIYQELGLENLHDRRWYRKLLLFFKICKGDAPQYLNDLLPPLVSQRGVQSQIFRPIKSNIYFYGKGRDVD